MQGPLEHGVNHPEERVRWTSPRRHRPDVGGLAAHREDEPQQQHELFIGERHSVLLQRNVVVAEGDVLLSESSVAAPRYWRGWLAQASGDAVKLLGETDTASSSKQTFRGRVVPWSSVGSRPWGTPRVSAHVYRGLLYGINPSETRSQKYDNMTPFPK